MRMCQPRLLAPFGKPLKTMTIDERWMSRSKSIAWGWRAKPPTHPSVESTWEEASARSALVSGRTGRPEHRPQDDTVKREGVLEERDSVSTPTERRISPRDSNHVANVLGALKAHFLKVVLQRMIRLGVSQDLQVDHDVNVQSTRMCGYDRRTCCHQIPGCEATDQIHGVLPRTQSAQQRHQDAFAVDRVPVAVAVEGGGLAIRNRSFLYEDARPFPWLGLRYATDQDKPG